MLPTERLPTGWCGETWLEALAVLERQARGREGGRSPEAWNGLGVMEARAAEALKRPDLLEKSIAHLRRALDLDPNAEPALVNLLSLLPRVGRHGEAREVEKRLHALRRRRAGRRPGPAVPDRR